jgi:hypothetical protein
MTADTVKFLDVRARLLPAAALLLAVAAIVGSAALLIWYGATIFDDLPLTDDWAFIDRLRSFVERKTGIDYFFIVHNGHPSPPGRALFYVSYLLDSITSGSCGGFRRLS